MATVGSGLIEMRRPVCTADNTGKLDQGGLVGHYLGLSCKVLRATRRSLLLEEGNKDLNRRSFLHKRAASVPFTGQLLPFSTYWGSVNSVICLQNSEIKKKKVSLMPVSSFLYFTERLGKFKTNEFYINSF